MQIKTIIKLAGGPTKVASLFPDLSKQAVCQWERVPAERCLTIEAATGGRVTRYDMRPDIYGIKPETSE